MVVFNVSVFNVLLNKCILGSYLSLKKYRYFVDNLEKNVFGGEKSHQVQPLNCYVPKSPLVGNYFVFKKHI